MSKCSDFESLVSFRPCASFGRCSLVIPMSFSSVSMYVVRGIPLFLFSMFGNVALNLVFIG